MKIKKILITGASGYIGQKLISELLQKNFELICIYKENIPSKYAQNKKIKWIKCDLSKSKINLRDGVQLHCVIHLCGITIGRKASIDKFFRINELALINTLESVSNKTKKFIFLSSQYVYGNPKSKKISENFFLNPSFNPYSASKINCENWLKIYQEFTGGMYFSLRLTGFIGGGGNIDYIIDKAKKNEDIVLFSKGNICRDYITFEFFNNIILRIINKAHKKKFYIFNTSSGQSLSSFLVAKMICKNINSKSEIKLSKKKNIIGNFVLQNIKLRKYLQISNINLKKEILKESKKAIDYEKNKYC